MMQVCRFSPNMQTVGIELPQGQTFQIHVGRELRMKLLVRSVIALQCYHLHALA